MSRGRAVGIDFGTTNSVVAYGPVPSSGVLAGEGDERRLLPSVVSFADDEALVGREAVERAVARPERTVRSVKRRLGDDFAAVELPNGVEYAPEQVAALVFAKLKRRAEAALDAPVTNAVVTVPAYFGHSRREATRRAARIAGLTVDRLVSEPTAACLSYGVGTAGDADETVLVYDLGGGTFDASLVDVTDGLFDVVASNGDADLGGDDWDDRLVAWFRERLDESATDAGAIDGGTTDADPTDSERSARLRRTARAARHDLTERSATTVELPSSAGDGVEVELTRERFDELTGDLAERTVDICDELFREANWNPWTVDRVLLVGGATRMPQVRDAVYEFFGQVPSADVDPDEVVATGAAIQADALHDVPAADDGGVTARRADSSGVGGRRADGGADAVLVDAVPRTLGVETMADGESGRFSPVVERNLSIPTERTRRYRTVEDEQTSVSVRIFQGDSDAVADNDFLGAFTLSGLPAAPAGEVSVDISFEVDENGILRVRAADEETGRSADVTIESAFDGTDGEIRRARQELPVLG